MWLRSQQRLHQAKNLPTRFNQESPKENRRNFGSETTASPTNTSSNCLNTRKYTNLIDLPILTPNLSQLTPTHQISEGNRTRDSSEETEDRRRRPAVTAIDVERERREKEEHIFVKRKSERENRMSEVKQGSNT